MKRYIPLGLIILSNLSLTGCATHHRSPSILNSDLTREAWMNEVNNNPNEWARGADKWFLTGDPNAAEMTDRRSPYSAAISTMNVKVSNFTNIKVNGDFQVQIFGTDGNNSVYVYGANDAVRSTIVEMQGDTLCVNQTRKVPRTMRNVIVRIGVNRLNSLTHLGCGTVEGIRLRSQCLLVTSNAVGNMYLAGNMNLKRVMSMGTGNISIFGANTPELDIKTVGVGTVNVSGNVGIRSIIHHGRGDVNIIGANSNNLKVYADGRGKIGINGIVNLRELKARDFTQVYAYNLTSNSLYAYAYDSAKIGLAGMAHDVYIDAFRSSCVGAKNLCSQAAFVRAHDNSHINIAGSNKLFAASTQNSSVYFFGSPAVMSQFVSGNGTVIPIWGQGVKVCPVQRPVYSYKAERVSYKGEKEPNYAYSKWHRRPSLKGEG